MSKAEKNVKTTVTNAGEVVKKEVKQTWKGVKSLGEEEVIISAFKGASTRNEREGA